MIYKMPGFDKVYVANCPICTELRRSDSITEMRKTVREGCRTCRSRVDRESAEVLTFSART